MSTKKNQEIRNLSIEDLENEIAETQSNYAKLKYDHSIQGLDNALLIREVRRDIARLKTEKRRREVEAMSSAELAGRSKIRDRRSNN